MTKEEIKTANKTARNWPKPTVVQKLVDGLVRMIQVESVLDFGAGPNAIQKKALESDFPHIDFTAYDFGDNLTEEHDEFALEGKYNVVYASNVLNVLVSKEAIKETLTQLTDCVYKDGYLVVNYPVTPRKCEGVSIVMLWALVENMGFTSVLKQDQAAVFKRIYP